MATVIREYWINPLTGGTTLPTVPIEIIQAAISYWNDELVEFRAKKPRSAEGKQEKRDRLALAAERIDRYRTERQNFTRGIKLTKTSVDLARNDLREVMRPAPSNLVAA